MRYIYCRVQDKIFENSLLLIDPLSCIFGIKMLPEIWFFMAEMENLIISS